ncbi:MAG TPA: hypothetical protein VMD02_00040 [Candidatus Omnitrophota bacterium]|nr:hypothetical protein [Candidatus Omnitrophota bacterium]
MNIEWQFFLGFAVGIMFMNILSLIGAYLRRRRALAELDATEKRLRALESELEARKVRLIGRIRKE